MDRPARRNRRAGINSLPVRAGNTGRGSDADTSARQTSIDAGGLRSGPARLSDRGIFLSGTATSYKLPGGATVDGKWDAAADSTAPYTSRIVVIRPTDPAKFNGTLLVEWFNVTAGQDTPADWMVAHREMLRRGYAYVGVSAQKVGVEGGATAMGQPAVPLK